jgi:hypothetical protein
MYGTKAQLVAGRCAVFNQALGSRGVMATSFLELIKLTGNRNRRQTLASAQRPLFALPPVSLRRDGGGSTYTHGAALTQPPAYRIPYIAFAVLSKRGVGACYVLRGGRSRRVYIGPNTKRGQARQAEIQRDPETKRRRWNPASRVLRHDTQETRAYMVTPYGGPGVNVESTS